MKKNKYLYGWKLWVNYGGGWEYEYFTDSFIEYKGIRRDYRENCNYPQKWTKARELNN
jgi:hypothetical protein